MKPEETLIYLYDGPMVGMSELGSVQVMASLVLPMVLPTDACEDNPTIRDETLFWLQTAGSVQALLAKAMEGICHSFSHGDKYYGTYS